MIKIIIFLAPFEDTKTPFEFHREEISKRNNSNNLFITNNCLINEFQESKRNELLLNSYNNPVSSPDKRLKEEEEVKSINSMKFEEESNDILCENNNNNNNKKDFNEAKSHKKFRFEFDQENIFTCYAENFEIIKSLNHSSTNNQKDIKLESISKSFKNNNKFIKRKTILEKNQLLKNLLATKKLFPKNKNLNINGNEIEEKEENSKLKDQQSNISNNICFSIADIFNEKENQKLFENNFQNSKLKFHLIGKVFEKANSSKSLKSCYKNNYEQNNYLQNSDFKIEQELIKRKLQNKNNIMILIHMNAEVNCKLFGFFYSKKISFSDFNSESLVKLKDKLSFVFNLDENFICKANENVDFNFSVKDEFLFSAGDPELKEGFLLGNDKLFINCEQICKNYLSSDLSVFGSVYYKENFFSKIEFVEVFQIEFL